MAIRTILVDVRLTGLLIGQSASHSSREIYRALMEAASFGALAIIDRIEEYGVPVHNVVVRRPGDQKPPVDANLCRYHRAANDISGSEQTPALGAGIFASVAAGKDMGGHPTVALAQQLMTRTGDAEPVPAHHQTYQQLFDCTGSSMTASAQKSEQDGCTTS